MVIVPNADPQITAVVVRRTPLRYGDAADPSLDRPAHIRAASSIARVPGGIALVQDDANFVAIVRDDGTCALAIALPAGYDGRRQFDDARGNKAHKLDLEACVAVEHESGGAMLIAFGSGATPAREHVAVIRGVDSERPDVQLVHAPLLYEGLRRERAFAGSELNIEGAIHIGDRLRFFGRGNGAARAGVQPVNATCDLDWRKVLAHLREPAESDPPSPSNVVRYELGSLGGVPLAFTDAAVWGEEVLFSAAAEDSPDAVRDGRVAGSAIGVVKEGGRTRWAPLTAPSGELFAGKVEGLLPADDGERLLVVVDADDPDSASELCTVELHMELRGV